MSEEGRPPNKGAKASKKKAAPGKRPSKGAKGAGRKPAPKPAGEKRVAASAPDPTAARGIALVLLAIVLGFFLLAKGLDSEGAIVDTETGDVVKDDGSDDTTVDTVPDDGTPATSVLTPTTRPAAEVKVLVANGSGVSGAAGRVSEQLQPFGFLMVEPSNAPSTSVTIVYYAPGYQGEGEAVAAKLGVDAANVQPLPVPAPPINRIGDANVVVQLGPDVAPAG